MRFYVTSLKSVIHSYLLLDRKVLLVYFSIWPYSFFFFFPSRTDPSSFCVPFFSKYESDELEKSTYHDYDSDSDVPEELKQDYVDEQTGDVPLKRSVAHRTHRGAASGVSQSVRVLSFPLLGITYAQKNKMIKLTHDYNEGKRF